MDSIFYALDIDRNLVEYISDYTHISHFIKQLKFFLFSLKELFTISITSTPFNIDWLVNF